MEKKQSKNRFFLKLLVIFIVALFFILWFLSTKNVFTFYSNDDSNNNETILTQLSNEFKEALVKMSADLDVIKKEEMKRQLEENELLSSVISEIKKPTSTIGNVIEKKENSLDQDVSNSLSDQIIDILKVDQAPKANVLNNSNNCPAYVNCMPMVDGVRNCQIPSGCDGITQLVY